MYSADLSSRSKYLNLGIFDLFLNICVSGAAHFLTDHQFSAEVQLNLLLNSRFTIVN